MEHTKELTTTEAIKGYTTIIAAAKKAYATETPRNLTPWLRDISGMKIIAGKPQTVTMKKFPDLKGGQTCPDLMSFFINGGLDDKGISAKQFKSILEQVAEQLAWMHQNFLTHGDLKPENILIQINGHEIQAFIADFDTVRTRAEIRAGAIQKTYTWKYLPDEMRETYINTYNSHQKSITNIKDMSPKAQQLHNTKEKLFFEQKTLKGEMTTLKETEQTAANYKQVETNYKQVAANYEQATNDFIFKFATELMLNEKLRQESELLQQSYDKFYKGSFDDWKSFDKQVMEKVIAELSWFTKEEFGKKKIYNSAKRKAICSFNKQYEAMLDSKGKTEPKKRQSTALSEHQNQRPPAKKSRSQEQSLFILTNVRQTGNSLPTKTLENVCPTTTRSTQPNQGLPISIEEWSREREDFFAKVRQDSPQKRKRTDFF